MNDTNNSTVVDQWHQQPRYVVSNQFGPLLNIVLHNRSGESALTPNRIAKVLCLDNLNQIVRRYFPDMRKGKIDRALSIIANIIHAADANPKDGNRFVGFYNSYSSIAEELGLPEVHKVSYHAMMSRDEYLQCFIEVVSQLMMASQTSLVPSPFMQTIKENLLDPLGLSDIAIGDGAFVATIARTQNEMPCKSTGRAAKQLGMRDKKTGLKLCILRTLLSRRLLQVSIDEGRKSEYVYDLEALLNTLFLYDRAMDSKKIRMALDELGISYVIRCRCKHIYRIVEAFNEEGHEMPELIGKQLRANEMPTDYNGFIDATIEVPSSNGVYRERVIICPALNTAEYISSLAPDVRMTVTRNEKRHMFLYTNLPRDKVNGLFIKNTYELRWDIELDIKQLRSTESLQQINSGKANIVLVNILASIAASILHKYATCCAQRATLQNPFIFDYHCAESTYYRYIDVDKLLSIAKDYYAAADAAKSGLITYDDNGIRAYLPTMVSENKIARHWRALGGEHSFYDFIKPIILENKDPEMHPECFDVLRKFATHRPSRFHYYRDFTASGVNLVERNDFRIKFAIMLDQLIKVSSTKPNNSNRLRQVA